MARTNPSIAAVVFVLFFVASALLCGTTIVEARGLTVPENPRVSTDKTRATIEGELDDASELVLRIGEEKDKLIWTNRFANAGAFKAVVELSDKIKLEDGSFGPGFVFSMNVGTTRSLANVHLPKTGPMPSGQLSFREDSKIVRKDGVITFADIRTEDGKLVPVSIFVRKTSK